MIGYGYIDSEYIINKGPDDVMAKSHVAAYLRYKYGDFDGNRMMTRITDFKPDEPQGKKGLYTIACSYKGRHLIVQTYYDGGDFYNWRDFPSGGQ